MSVHRFRFSGVYHVLGMGRAERWAFLFGIALALVGAIATSRMILRDPVWPMAADLGYYLDAARALAEGRSPYPAVLAGDSYAYPPLLAAALMPLTAVLGVGKLWSLWVVLCAMSLGFSIVLMLRGFGHKVGFGWIALIFGFLMVGRMVRSDLYHGQVNMLLLALIVFGLREFLHRHTVRGALAWAVVIGVKPFLGVLVLFLLWRKNWRASITTLGMCAAVFAASFVLPFSRPLELVSGWRAVAHYYTGLPRVSDLDNQSFYGFFVRILTDTPSATPWVEAPQAVPFLMLLVVAVAAAIFVYGVPSRPGPKDSDLADGPHALLQLGVLLALSLGCGPLTEGDHMFFVFPALAGASLIMAAQRRDAALQFKWWAAAVAAWCFALGAFACPVVVSFFIPKYLTPDVAGLKLLVTARLCFALFLAALVSGMATRKTFTWLFRDGSDLAAKLRSA